MIIPPVALAIGAVVVVVKLLISDQVDSPNDEEIALKAERNVPINSHYASNCRFRSEKIPYRDLSFTPSERTDTTSNTPDQSDEVADKTEDSNKLMDTDEGPLDRSKLKFETPEDSDT
ncbi:MAG: hypothetical protein F4X44_12725 [Gammaproteobacteria bacterium]|nr:hypothetical protein [Gammaproteobacteria bacterium]MYD81460.1 hypothetical protein [Gammaproteobacteria bacterium]